MVTLSPILTLLAALALTIAVEGLGMLCCTRRWRFVLYSAAGNMLTNPLINLAMLLAGFVLRGAAWYALLAVLELAVVAAEGLLYRRLCGWPPGKALLVSLVLNALSFLAGRLIF